LIDTEEVQAMRKIKVRWIVRLVCPLTLAAALVQCAGAADDWTQLRHDARHSGDAPQRNVQLPLGLAATAAMDDAVLTAPVVAGGRVYVVDASGTAWCLDADTLAMIWKHRTSGGPANTNNVSSPAVVGNYLHFGTMAGAYYVLDARSGKLVRRIACGEPIFCSPVVANQRVYFATLGSQVYALEPDGRVVWTWDYVRTRLNYQGDRWSGEQWCKHAGGRANWKYQFTCPIDLAVFGRTLVVPAGGEVLWLDDAGPRAELRVAGVVPNFKGNERPAPFGLTLDQEGAVYLQWHRRDNTGRVEILRLADGKLKAEAVPGTLVRNDLPGSMGVSAVSVRGQAVYRCRPEEGFGLCRHVPGQEEPDRLGGYPSVSTPILLADKAVFGALDGRLYVVPLGGGKAWSFATAFGRAITAPVAVANGRIYFGCEDGYLYALSPDGKSPLPTKDLQLDRIRSPLSGKFAAAQYNWYSNYGNAANTNSNCQGLKPPIKLAWIRRFEGTFKHAPVCGGGRMYTHTAEGQILAVEQETGRLLWRRFFPGVHISYTGPVYHQERLLVAQAGLERSRVRCLDAATGRLLWEAPFTGSPSWSRQQAPIVHKNLVFYAFSTGKYAPLGHGIYVFGGKKGGEAREGEETVSWLFSHDNPNYPANQRPLLKAWDLQTGREVWSKDFSQYGAGGDHLGICLLDGTLYYSCFFGYAPKGTGPKGITVALEPETGRRVWFTDKYSVTAGCTISGEQGRIYLGGYNSRESKTGPRYVWCLNARDGSLVWRSEPVTKAINVVTVGQKVLLVHAYGGDDFVLDKATGKILSKYNFAYACTRFTFSEPFAIGSNMDLIDVTDDNRVVSSGPPIDLRECVGGDVSNGRLYYITQANGLAACQRYGEEAAGFRPVWEE
jgi:outer membrane protein assembly factor BamB